MVAFLEGPELLIVAVIVLLVFGGSKIPQLARSLGEAQREFRKASEGDRPGGEAATGTEVAPPTAEPPTLPAATVDAPPPEEPPTSA